MLPGEVVVFSDANAGSDDSTDDDEPALVMEVEAVFQWKPCLWVKFAYKLLLRAFICSNPFLCVRSTFADSATTWNCYRRSTVRSYLGLGPKDFELNRDDIKFFGKIQGGEFLHRIRWEHVLHVHESS